MPVQPNNGKLYIELDSEHAVRELIDVARALDPEKAAKPWATADGKVAADIEDHLLFLSATHPEWFSSYREEAIIELATRLPMAIEVGSILLYGAGDEAVAALVRRLDEQPDNWGDLGLLASIGTEGAMASLADHVRAHDVGEWVTRMGVHVGRDGAAVRRFSVHRYAVETVADTSGGDCGVAIGLPLADIVHESPSVITWHYLSLETNCIEDVPAWGPGVLHVVSPRTYWYTLHCRADDGGRYFDATFDDEGEPFDAGMAEAEADPPGPAAASLRPYDADLIYRNGHVMLSPNVVGTAGGPPIGLYPNPVCPDCGVLMFHVVTVESGVREYGEGFRSGFICETCQRAAVTGTNWN